jgi:hypothetical protein
VGYAPLVTTIELDPPDPGVSTHKLDFALTPKDLARASKQEVEKNAPKSRFLPDGSPYAGFALLGRPIPDMPPPYGLLDVQVMDTANNNPLRYAYIWVYELNQGAKTDVNGRYVIGPIPHGTYTIIAMVYDYWMRDQTVEIRPPAPVEEHTLSLAKVQLWMHPQP